MSDSSKPETFVPAPPLALSEADLAPWAQILLNDAYLLRPRGKCSREDFAQGFVGALAAVGWRSAFVEAVAAPEHPLRAFALPALVEAIVAAGPGALLHDPEAVARRPSGPPTIVLAPDSLTSDPADRTPESTEG